MKIKKVGHCCLFIQIENENSKLNILTDPGAYSIEQNNLSNIDLVLITHEHADHLHTGSIKEILANNPNVKIISNSSVSEILKKENIECSILEGKGTDNKVINGILIEAYDARHEEIFGEIGQVKNTGYFIDNKLFYPGDAFCNPGKHVDILAMPVAGPWCRISEVIKYALLLKPSKAFPVHDGMLQPNKIGAFHKIPEKVLSENGIEFVIMNNGDEIDF